MEGTGNEGTPEQKGPESRRACKGTGKGWNHDSTIRNLVAGMPNRRGTQGVHGFGFSVSGGRSHRLVAAGET